MFRLAIIVILSACRLVPAEVLKDIEYGRAAGNALLLDVSLPRGDGPYPAAIIVHGGAWSGGDKASSGRLLFPPLNRSGIACFSVNYRLAPDYPYPAAVEDVETAIRFVRENARRFKVDPKRIGLIGESAGGHLVLLVASRNRPKSRVSAVVSFYGRADLQKGASQPGAAQVAIKRFLKLGQIDESAQPLLREASPIHTVKAAVPPFLLIHGTSDTVVPHSESVNMCRKVKELKGTCDLVLVEGAPHGINKWKEQASLEYLQTLPRWLSDRL